MLNLLKYLISVGGYGYGCEIQSFILSSPDDRVLRKVTDNHETGKTDNDVIVFCNDGKIKNFFLQNIINVFKNVQKILIHSANLAIISKYDLQPFGSQLKIFSFYGNKLEAIESDLFEFTPNLELIQFQSNKIKYVSKGAFSHLSKFSYFNFHYNACHHGLASDRSGVLNLISTIERKCTDHQALQKHRNFPWIEELKSEITKLINNQNEKIDELKAKHDAEIDIKIAAMEKLQQEIEKIKQGGIKNEEMMQKIINLETKIDAKLNAIEFKLDETKLASASDTSNEQFTSINATCTALEFKIDVLKQECVSKPLCRLP